MNNNRTFADFCKKRRGFVIVIILISLLSVAVLYRSNIHRDNMFIMDEHQVLGIKGDKANQGVTLSVVAKQDDITVEREVILKRSAGPGENEKTEKYKYSPEDELNTEITRLVRGMNQSEDDVLMLPNHIGDNVSLVWDRKETKYSWLLPIIFPPLLLLFMYRGERNEIKQEAKREVDSIVNELPSFNNKLVLLLGSGLVYEESIRRIAVSNDYKGKNILPVRLGEIIKDAECTNGDTTKLLNEFARKKKIPELKRMTTIIMDNQKKGTDLRSKLVLEGELLWDRRKKRAEEQGRASESKLTLPLGVMMIALLIVTAGPALMQM